MKWFALTRWIIVTNFCTFIVIISLHTTTWSCEEPVHQNEILNVLNKSNFTPSPFDWNSASGRFVKRLRRLRKVCRTKPLPPIFDGKMIDGKLQVTRIIEIRKTWKPNMNFLVDVPRNLLVCAVPKCGSTSWHRTIWAVRRKRLGMSIDQKFYTPNDTVRNQGIAMHVSAKDGNSLISHTEGDDDFRQKPPNGSRFRIILARHPFARFISGWNQKFMLSTNYWLVLVKCYPKLLEYKMKVDLNRVMAFEDFANYAARHPTIIKSRNEHFIPATILCSPCEYDYTYVVKAETVDADEPWLKRRLGLDDIDVGRRGVPPGGSVVNKDLKGNIRKYMSLLTNETVKALYEIYQDDFEYFGYTFNFTTLEPGWLD